MSDFSFWVILSNLLLATRWTILLSLIAFVSGGIVALVLLFARVSGNPWLERVTRWYIEFFQGTPLLMQLFLAYFGLYSRHRLVAGSPDEEFAVLAQAAEELE